MRPFVLLVILFGTALAQSEIGQGDVLTLAAVLEQAPAQDPDVLGAETALRAAERTLQRLRADPLALLVPTLQAEGALESARAGLSDARLASYTEVTAAFFGALEANGALELANETLALERAKLQATQIRFEAGAATGLELLQAENRLAAAERDVTDAQSTQSLALRRLGTLIRAEASRLEPVSLVPPAVPTLEQVLQEATETNSGVRAAASAVGVAEAELAAVDNAFSARADIEAVQDNLVGIESDLETARKSLELSVREAHGALESAARSFENAQADFAAAEEELTAQQARLDAGSLAPIALDESRLVFRQSEVALYGALHRFRLAALALEEVVSGGEGEVSSDVTTPAPSEPSTLEKAEPLPDAAPVEPERLEPDVPEPTLPAEPEEESDAL